MTIKLGWKAGAEQYPPTERLDCAVAADQEGFDLLDTTFGANRYVDAFTSTGDTSSNHRMLTAIGGASALGY